MAIAQEEVFGPVVCVIPFGSEAEAAALANDSRFGLAAEAWTRDLQRGYRMAAALHAGTVWLNAWRVVSYTAPFGGFRQSDIERENGREAINQYLETKTVRVELSCTTRDPFTIG